MSKINEDKCTYCSVEAPAMVYKCPECEFNPERKKETIINGIDVSKCEFLWKEKLPKKVCNNGNLDCDCNSHQNCIFRQFAKTKKKLQVKEQECEKWKHQAELGSDTTDRLAKELECKEQECESLKLRFEKLRQFNKKLIAENFEIGCRNIRYKNICNEIEKISTTAYSLTNGTNKDMSDFAKQIINNINRTKEENQCEQ